MANSNDSVVYDFQVHVAQAIKDLDSFGSALKRVMNISTTKGPIKSLQLIASASAGAAKAVTKYANSTAKALTASTESTIKYAETLNMYEQALGSASEAGNNFIDSISDMYGLDPAYLTQWTATFYEMGHAVGMPIEAAQKLSQNLTSLSVDIGSLFDYSFDEVADNLASAMRGMSRSVLKYGMDTRAATISAYALERGITKKWNTMNEAEREILRYIVAVKQASDAQGDFAKTIESPANQLRVLKEQLAQVGRNIGNFLVQPLAQVLPYLNAVAMVLKTITTFLVQLFHVTDWIGKSVGSATDTVEDETSAITGLGNAASDAAKKAKALLAPFDELNVLQESTASAGGGGAAIDYGTVDPEILALLDTVQYKMQEVEMEAERLYRRMLDWLGISISDDGKIVWDLEILRNNLKEITGHKWDIIIDAVFDTDWKAVFAQFKQLFALLGEIAKLSFKKIYDDLKSLLELFGIDISQEGIARFITELPDNLSSLTAFLDNNKESIANWIATALEITAIVSIFTALTSALSALTPVGELVVLSLSDIEGGINSVYTLAYSLVSLVGTKLPVTFATAFGAISILIIGVVAGFQQMWQSSATFRNNIAVMLKEVVGLFSDFVNMIWDLMKLLWNYAIGPIVQVIGNLFAGMLAGIVNTVTGIVQIIRGLITSIDAILNGDGKQAFIGFLTILVGLINVVIGLVESVVNAALGVVTATINFFGNLLYEFVQGIVATINFFRSIIGAKPIDGPSKDIFVLDKPIALTLPTVSTDAIKFATGGVVTGPTRALIGEAGRSEAVIPLDNSPQMEELIDRIADKVGGDTVVKVYIGDKEWDAFTYKSARRGEKLVGAQPVTT